MKTFRINYFRKNNNESDAMLPDALTVFDQAEFDVEDGNETALLRLFSAFVAENEYEVLSISTIDEVSFDGREEYPFQNTFMDRVNTLTASAHSFLSALAIGGVERNDDLIESLVLCGKAILEKQHIDTCFPSYGPNGVPCYRRESCPGKKMPVSERRSVGQKRREDQCQVGKEPRREVCRTLVHQSRLRLLSCQAVYQQDRVPGVKGRHRRPL